MSENITPAGTDFSKWQRHNLERLAVELTAEVLRLRAELNHWFGCAVCGERHDGDCPPSEMRTTGQAWFYRALREAHNRESKLRAELDAARGCPHCGPACDLMPKEKS